MKDENRMIELLRMPEAEATFSRANNPIPLFEPPKGYLDLFYASNNLDDVDIDLFLQNTSETFGITGSGKSNCMGRKCEEMLKKGVKLNIVDYKGEYQTLMDMEGVKMHMVRISANAVEEAHKYLEQNHSIDINLKGEKSEDYMPFLDDFFRTLWDLRRQQSMEAEKNGEIIVPNKTVIDEAQNFLPREMPANAGKEQNMVAKSLLATLRNFAKQGRSYGETLDISTQRPSSLDTDVRTQGQIFLLFKQTWYNDLDIYRALIPSAGNASDWKKIGAEVATMPRGQCIFVKHGNASFARVKKKRSKDLASTPAFAQIKGWKAGTGQAL